MKGLFNVLLIIIKVIAFFVFVSGVTFSILGVYDFAHAFSYLSHDNKSGIVGFIGIGLLRSVDLFLIAIVLFVFSIGLLVLFFGRDETAFPQKIPAWLRVKDFIELKALLWEAILTTLVVSYLTGLAERRLNGGELVVQDLIVPGAILLIAISLFFLKKGKKHEN